MDNKDGVQVTEVKQYKFAIRFQDGERDGKPHDFVYGFAIEAKSEAEAKDTLHRHLGKCVEKLDEGIISPIKV